MNPAFFGIIYSAISLIHIRKVCVVLNSACFVGHTQLTATPALEQSIFDAIEELITNGITDFFVGGSYGFDLLCAKSILTAKQQHLDIRLHIILPCSEKELVKKWKNNNDINELHHVLTGADTIERCSKRYYEGCFKDRNIKLIEQSDVCICYYDNNKKYYSSTGQAVRLAINKKISVVNLFGKE